jgi:Uncharacterised nucleotidyltransferase
MARRSRFPEPGPRDRLLLRAAVVAGPQARAAWDEWFADVELDDLPFDEARLLPRVYANFAAQGTGDCLPPRLRGKYRWVWTANQLRSHAVAPALRALADARIPTVLLKGAALLASERCPWGAREMGDVDILVPTGREADAARALDTAGWVAQGGVTPEFLARRLVLRRHGWNYERRAPHDNLDLHWHAFEAVRAGSIDAELFRHARRVRFGDVELLALDDADQVLHLIEHASHGEPAHRLAWIADVSGVLDLVDAERLARRARELGVHDLASEALDALARTLGTMSAQQAAKALGRCPAGARERLLAATETGAIGGRSFPRLSELARAAAVHGFEARHPLRTAADVLRRRVEPALCRHRALSVALALTGRPRRIEVAALRGFGPLARPPAPRALRPGEWVDLTTACALDHVAGAGWSWPMPDGVWTDGAEARLSLDTAVPRGRPLVLEFRFGPDVHRSPNPRAVVLVNGRPLTEWRFGSSGEYTPPRLDIPAWLGDWCRPIDVVIRSQQPFVPARRDRGPGDAQPAVQLRALRVLEG